MRGALYHSQSPEAFYCHVPGLKVVLPSTPSDAKGLLKAAIRDPDPVIFLEPKKLYRAERAELADGDAALLPLGSAAVVRDGTDVTAVTYGYMRAVATQAATRLHLSTNSARRPSGSPPPRRRRGRCRSHSR